MDTPSSDPHQSMERFRAAVERILTGYRQAADEKFNGSHPMAQTFGEAARALGAFPELLPRQVKVVPSAGKGRWASVPWIALLDPRETTTTQHGVYIVYLFRGDMSGVYATLNQGVTELDNLSSKEQARELTKRAESIRTQVPELATVGFALDNHIELRSSTPLGAKYEPSTIAHKLYRSDALPNTEELAADLQALLAAYATYLDHKGGEAVSTPSPADPRAAAFARLVQHVGAAGFVFEPWQVAAYVTALRTKPFVILAGVSGTGKSQLPQLVSTATGAAFQRVSVRPDWTDSSEVLGYVDLSGAFRPGVILELAKRASVDPARQHVGLLDEMNLARVEQYFAELLSGMEDRRPAETGGFASPPLLVPTLSERDLAWAQVGWGPNLALVGTVNMDESTHGFSKKVLDRAFTLEMSDIDLAHWQTTPPKMPEVTPWPMSWWHPRAQRLSELSNLSQDERALINLIVARLVAANTILAAAQVQVGYRVRDEIVMFALHARDLAPWFRTRTGEAVDPLDLALHMKLLPRLAGGSGTIRRVLSRLLGWAVDERLDLADDQAEQHLARWEQEGRPSALPDASLPRTAARLCLMWDRLEQEGFTSYWL